MTCWNNCGIAGSIGGGTADHVANTKEGTDAGLVVEACAKAASCSADSSANIADAPVGM
jgi:hypothetical protein